MTAEVSSISGFRVARGLAWVVVALVALMEIWGRAVEATPYWRTLPVVEVSLYGPDPWTGYALRPRASGIWTTENRAMVAINSLGLRDRETTLAKPKGRVRIALIGDSRVEALQVDANQTMDSVAERILSRNGDIEVLNFGLAGATPAVQIARFRYLGLKFSPEIAVFMMQIKEFGAGQMSDDSAFPAYLEQAGGGFELSYGFRKTRGYRFRTSAAGRALYWLIDRSRFVTFLNSLRNRGFVANAGLWIAKPAANKMRERACANWPPEALWVKGRHPRALGRARAFLRDLAAFRRDLKSPVILALEGLREDCTNQAQQEAVIRAIKAELAPAGIVLLDVDAELRRIAGSKKARRAGHGWGRNKGFGHLNPKGHALYGAMLVDALLPRIQRMSRRP